ncbi:MAG TPA: hypothetical protein VIL28_11645 [Steroidobacteraceae bacterium]
MKTSVLVLGVATLASTIASAYFWQALRQERSQSVALQTRIAELEERLIAAAAKPQPPAASEQPPAPTESSEAAELPPEQRQTVAAFVERVDARPAQMDADTRRRFVEEARERQQRLLKDPEYRALMRDQQKLAMQRMYGDINLFLDLTPEEIDRLMDVLAEQALRNMEEPPMMVSLDGTQPSEAEMRERRRMVQERQRQNEAEIAAVLGDKYRDWQEYQRSGQSRSQIAQLRQTLSLTNEPLRQDQIKPLTEIMTRELQTASSRRMSSPRSMRDPQERVRMAEEMLERTAQAHQRILDAAAGLLSPAQLEQLRRQQEQQIKAQELALRQQRARAEAQAGGDLPTDFLISVPGTAYPYP